MDLKLNIRLADNEDREKYADLAVALSRFNRAYHDARCEYDDYDSVLAAVRKRAVKIFDDRDEDILILLAEIDDQPVGYTLARIYTEEDTADNGTGRMGLIDELFLSEEARGGAWTEIIGQWRG